jgi:hypothetical protein
MSAVSSGFVCLLPRLRLVCYTRNPFIHFPRLVLALCCEFHGAGGCRFGGKVEMRGSLVHGDVIFTSIWFAIVHNSPSSAFYISPLPPARYFEDTYARELYPCPVGSGERMRDVLAAIQYVFRPYSWYTIPALVAPAGSLICSYVSYATMFG